MPRTTAKKKPARRKPEERWLSIYLVTERWFIPSHGLAKNLTNSFNKKPSSILVTCDPVAVIALEDLDALAEAIESRIDWKPKKLPPITSWRDRGPDAVSIAAGFKSWMNLVGHGARSFKVRIKGHTSRVTESARVGAGFSSSEGDPESVLRGKPSFAKIAQTLVAQAAKPARVGARKR